MTRNAFSNATARAPWPTRTWGVYFWAAHDGRRILFKLDGSFERDGRWFGSHSVEYLRVRGPEGQAEGHRARVCRPAEGIDLALRDPAADVA